MRCSCAGGCRGCAPVLGSMSVPLKSGSRHPSASWVGVVYGAVTDSVRQDHLRSGCIGLLKRIRLQGHASRPAPPAPRRLCAWAARRVQGTMPRHLPYVGAFVGIASLTLDSGNDVDYVYGTGCKRNRQRFQHESFQDVDVPGPRSDEDDVARSTSRLNRDDLACRQGAHAGVLPQHWLPTGCCDRPTRPRVESCVARRRNHISWTPCRRRTWECAQSRGSRR